MLPVPKLFSSNERIFKINLEGITHEESLKQMHNCNTVNWIVGHLAYTRNSILDTMHLQQQAEAAKLNEIYARGVVNPDMSKAAHLDTLKQIFMDAQPLIMQGLEKAHDETTLERLAFLGLHEAYHLGQLGIWRKMLGKEGGIK